MTYYANTYVGVFQNIKKNVKEIKSPLSRALALGYYPKGGYRIGHCPLEHRISEIIEFTFW
jgi:hypothetical protein